MAGCVIHVSHVSPWARDPKIAVARPNISANLEARLLCSGLWQAILARRLVPLHGSGADTQRLLE